MRKSIFDIENRLDIRKEFDNLIEILYKPNTIYYKYCDLSLYEFLNNYIFSIWEYRDTFIELEEYFEHIGINDRVITKYENLTKESFLNFLELLINLVLVARAKINTNSIIFNNIKVKNVISHNVPLILEKMNYELYDEGNTIRIRKRDADVDSVLDIVPEDIAMTLLAYNDIRNNNIESKKTLLKKIDLYIDKDKKKYKSIGKELLDSIETVVNKMGINHKPDEAPFNNLDNDELIKWYDKCFKMMIHLIRTEEITNIKKERNKLITKENN